MPGQNASWLTTYRLITSRAARHGAVRASRYRGICIKHLATSNRYPPIHTHQSQSKWHFNNIRAIQSHQQGFRHGQGAGKNGRGSLLPCRCNGARIFRFWLWLCVWASLWVSEHSWTHIPGMWVSLCESHQWFVHKYYKLGHTHSPEGETEREPHSPLEWETATLRLEGDGQRLAEIVSKETFAFQQNVSLSKCISPPVGGCARVRHKDIDSPIKITVVDCEWHVKEEIRRCSHSHSPTFAVFEYSFFPKGNDTCRRRNV